ncbi:PREDICTED: probable tetraacyldisaccharide 4'-kinase, mitochondrial isoform X2 [Nelumbo nucifera]|uniref:tetraacyldisaccharide 4'-kinase n=1 Tax=Nelumbo nucifera TaxID=4432 RepID=A0A1U8QCC1_NELNU|nr:PREDICTED: probable tetraacyldisaccharide 4'-kinase, mitochondrial isoform X2 [Nelumbo nucifera]
MENLRRLVGEIAQTRRQDLPKLSPLQRSFIPLLSFSSIIYGFALFVRHQLYYFGFFHRHRLPVPVISVGNLTWGGNGKTPMVEFIAHWFIKSGVSPLILTRGYAGGDEAKMLQRHLIGTPAKIGVGANRIAIAACFFGRYGYLDSRSRKECFDRLHTDLNVEMRSNTDKIGAVILDDGLQHWRLHRDLEILMVNGMMPWGNGQLLPLGPLREPLSALSRADVAVIHNAEMVPSRELKDIELMIREVKKNLPIFLTKLAPSYFFEVKNYCSKLPLTVVSHMAVFCVSAIGFASAFVQEIEKMGPLYVDRLGFSDHHWFQYKDIVMMKQRLRKLQDEFGAMPIVVVTEKVLVLCCQLQIVPSGGHTEKCFNKLLKQFMEVNFS